MKIRYFDATLCLFSLIVSSSLKAQAQANSTTVTAPSADEANALFDQWKQYCLHSPASTLKPFFNNPPFLALRRSGANGVAVFIEKIREGETFSFVPLDFLSTMPAITRTKFKLSVVKTAPDVKSTVFSVEEFPDMEIGRQVNQDGELWLKWWAEKDAKIPVWFRGRYQMWKTAKAGTDKTKAEAAYRKTVDLGIFALPQWMEKLQSDPKESRAIIAAISELSSAEVAPDATLPQVQHWWKENKDKWTKVG